MMNSLCRRACRPHPAPRQAYPRVSCSPLLHLHQGPRAQAQRFASAHHRDAAEEDLNPRLNPPDSTRPPPLQRPVRNPSESKPKYYFNLGRAFLTFYKNGFKAVFSNRHMLPEIRGRLRHGETLPLLWPGNGPRTISRADWVTFWRIRHDLLRIPLFGIILVICGEFTPFVVLLVEGAVPYTCRIPDQNFRLRSKAEQRRREAFDELDARHPDGPYSAGLAAKEARAHVLKSLHLTGAIWDRLGGITPPGMWELKGKVTMEYLEGDDERLLKDGGPFGLSREELRIACAERGIDILNKSHTELMGWLGDWLRLTTCEDAATRRQKMGVLLLTRAENWPRAADFALPKWQL